MSSLPHQANDREASDDDAGQGSQPAKRHRCSTCGDDRQIELLEEMRNILQQQNQKIECIFQENQQQNQKIEYIFQGNQYLRQKVSSLTAKEDTPRVRRPTSMILSPLRRDPPRNRKDISRLDGYFQQSPTPRVLLSDQHYSIQLRLKFLNSCKNDKYSKHKIEADDKNPLKVAICDHKNEIITREPFSSMRVHIVPVQGDFDNDHKGQWTEEYFLSKIVSGRPGKEPLLFGDLYIRLQNGVGYLNTAKFQDNSSFVASKRFKLGVMAADERIPQRIQEGITESFAVKDIRGYSSKKNLYPSPRDPVHKLRRIAKDGDRHKLLEQHGIKTVGDFILSYNQSHEDLRKILGKISDQDWDMIIDHALKCNPRPGNHEHQISSRSDGSYYIPGSSSIQPTSSAPQKHDYVQVNQQISSPYTELSSGVSLEDAPREQMGSQVDQDQISGAGNEFLSVSQQAHSSGYDDITFDEEDMTMRNQLVHLETLLKEDFVMDDLKMDALFGVPVIEDPGWPRRLSQCIRAI